MIKRFLGKVVLWCLDLEQLRRRMEETHKQAQRKGCVCDDAVKFGATSRVLNEAKKPEKISIKGQTIIDGELLVFPYGGQLSIGDKA